MYTKKKRKKTCITSNHRGMHLRLPSPQNHIIVQYCISVYSKQSTFKPIMFNILVEERDKLDAGLMRFTGSKSHPLLQERGEDINCFLIIESENNFILFTEHYSIHITFLMSQSMLNT